jgi:hypothetical protein
MLRFLISITQINMKSLGTYTQSHCGTLHNTLQIPSQHHHHRSSIIFNFYLFF